MARKYLPKLPSAGLKLALADLEKAEKNPKLKIAMPYYMLTPEPDSIAAKIYGSAKCLVCLAGSVMVNTLQLPIDKIGATHPWTCNLPDSTSRKLQAIDSLRLGSLQYGAAEYLGLEDDDGVNVAHPKVAALRDSVKVTEYSVSPAKFKRDVRKIIKSLEKHGL
jgi:hypothetical protein